MLGGNEASCFRYIYHGNDAAPAQVYLLKNTAPRPISIIWRGGEEAGDDVVSDGDVGSQSLHNAMSFLSTRLRLATSDSVETSLAANYPKHR